MVTHRDDGTTHFRFYRPNAANVFIAGDFNDWRTDQLKMKSAGNGYWELSLRLPAGDHRFRYVADGLWYTDFAAFGVEPERFGMVSVLHIPVRTVALHVEPTAPATQTIAAA
jgi:1,4-alpha-glucan branching enzyme